MYRKLNGLLSKFARLSICAVFCTLTTLGTAQAQSINFESPTYTLGNINGQDGWSKTGPYDVNVVGTSVPGFGAQSLRISNGIASGSFGDQAFSKSNANEAGETSAQNGGLSGGIRQNHFEYQFSITSAVPGAQQPGLLISTSPDRGDGARMSYLRFEDQPDGIHIFFDDYQDLAPYGTTIAPNDPLGCGAEDDFFETDIATISRNTTHTIRFVIDFADGPRNDVVKIYVDGILKKVGTTWEDYFRYCEGNQTRTVDSMLFRAGGSSVPANLGNGFLIDGISAASGAESVVKITSANLTAVPNLQDWFFYNDQTDVINNTLGSFITGPATPPRGSGSAQISVTGSERRNLATYRFSGTPLANITTMKFSTYNPATGNGQGLNASAYLNFNVDFNLTDTFQNRLVYVPSANGAIVPDSWKEWDTINGGNALWSYSKTSGCACWPLGMGGGGEPATTLKTWSQILSQYPSIRIRVSDPFMGIRVGEPYPLGYTENIDSFTFGTSAGTTVFDFEPLPILVDDDGVQCPTAAFTTIQAAINAATPGATVQVCAGTYTEDVTVNKANLTLVGAGVDVSTIVGPYNTTSNTVLVSASGVTIDGFTITRNGNTVATWPQATNLKNQGINVAASTGVTIQNSKLTGNRNAIYVGQSSNNVTIRRNIIDFNRTGIHLVDNNGATIEENFITNNWTMGILYRTEGGPAPTMMTVRGNNISANWYKEIEFREPSTGGLLNMSGNYLGTTAPTRNTISGGEPGYNAQIPIAYGGTAVPPATKTTITGAESARVDYSPFLNSGVDTLPGTPGFQGDLTSVILNADSTQANGAGGNIQEGVNLANIGGSATALAGTYSGNIDINRAVTLKGTPTFTGSLRTSASGAAISPGFSPGIINSGNLTLTSGSTLNIELNGTAVGTQYDQVNVTGTVDLGGATLNLTSSFLPGVGNTFTIVNNDDVDAVTNTFNGLPEGAVVTIGLTQYTISYFGGSGNDVVLTATVAGCNNVSIAPTNITTLTGVPVSVPVNTDDVTGRGVLSFDFTITYNNAVITAPVVTSTTITSGGTITTNIPSPGTLEVSYFGVNPLAGSGNLMNITFNTVGGIGTSSPVAFSSAFYNEGNPCLNTTNGSVTVISGTISGLVSYGNALLPTPGFRPVPNATLNAAGSVSVSTNSAFLTGAYSLSGMGAGAYTVTPSKSGDVNGITNFDCTAIAQHAVLITPLVGNQLIVADVTGNGTVTSLDAAYIARYIALLPVTGSTGTWRFVPTSRSYPLGVTTNFSGEDYTALLMGEVTGNWVAPTSFAPLASLPETLTKNAVRVGIPEVTAGQDSEFTVPVTVTNTTRRGVTGFEFELRYDHDVIQPLANTVEIAGTMSEGFVATVNSSEPGLLRVVVFGTVPMNGEGILLNLRFSAVGSAGSTSPLTWLRFMMNEGKPGSVTTGGQVTISAASNNAAIAGKLLTPMGEAVRNATVTLTDTLGGSRTVRSNSFGNFRFGELTVGQTYSISVKARGFTFTPATVSVTDELTTLDMIADQ